MHRLALAASLALALVACAEVPDDECFDDDDQPIACEPLPDVPELPDDPALEPIGGEDAPGDLEPGPDDLDGLADESEAEPLDEPLPPALAAATGSAAITAGKTHRAELRKFLPIGRTPGARRYVVMRLRPRDLPDLARGDTLRAAAELQVTTRCDVGQVAPGCDYNPRVALQLVLSDDPDGTNPHARGTVALSRIHKLACTRDDHHCVEAIGFSDARLALRPGAAPRCVDDDRCYVNLVAWAYHADARGDGKDVLLIGANEGNFLDNGEIEQDRGRIMAIRERGLTAGDVAQRVTRHTVRRGAIALASNDRWTRIYSHTLNGGADLRAGQKFRVWTNVDASSNHRVNLSLLFFATKHRFDRNGGSVDALRPAQLTEHNGTNCSPGNDCHLRKVAVFEVDRDVRGPVYLNVAASTEVPGPGVATTTIHDTGFIKAVRYDR